MTVTKQCQFGLKTKSEAINFVIHQYEDELLEPQLRPEYVAKIRNIEKRGKFHHYKSLTALRKEVEHA